ncbi:hypothetical protein NU219Hw_g3672t2 [Hortaea werneckii]
MGLLDRVNGSIAYQKVSSNPDGSSLPPTGGDGATGLKGLLARQGKVLVAFFLAVGALLFYIGSPVSDAHASVEDQVPYQNTTKITHKPSQLHLVIPASKEDPNLCKVFLSAAVLGYPAPVVINWGQTFDDPNLVEGGSHLAKIKGVGEYVNSLDSSHDEDLVLMVDGYDIWLQLRPQTLIDRFFEINRKADARIQWELGKEAAEKNGVKQEIIFGCQKRCWPWKPSDPPCYAVPNSTLPEDIYGPGTDTLPDWLEDTQDVNLPGNPFGLTRQRFLNSGGAMGTVRAFRKLLDQALKLAEVEGNFGSDQYIFSHIYGDQEVWREAVRRDSANTAQGKLHRLQPWNGQRDPPKGFHSHFIPEHIAEVRQKAAATEDGDYEFGIGVDHESQIVLNTVFAEEDTEWLTFSNTAQLVAAYSAHGVNPAYGAAELSGDIATSLPPYWTFTHESELEGWRNRKWDQVPLLTNVFTGIPPAIIHHNAHRDGLKSRRESWWPLTHYHPRARTLLDAYIYAPVTPVAVSGYDEAGLREWWPYEMWKGGGRNGLSPLGSTDDGWIKFDDICRDHAEELFRDGKGTWELPANH